MIRRELTKGKRLFLLVTVIMSIILLPVVSISASGSLRLRVPCNDLLPVHFDVIVRGPAHSPITDLVLEDFSLEKNGVTVPIQNVIHNEAGDFPGKYTVYPDDSYRPMTGLYKVTVTTSSEVESDFFNVKPMIIRTSVIQPGTVDPSIVVELLSSTELGETFTGAATSTVGWKIYTDDTGLELDSITEISDKKVSLNFVGTAQEGTLAIKTRSFAISNHQTSNTLGISILETVYGEVESSTEGINLYYAVSIPENPKAIIVIVHGIDEHLGRYDYVANKLNGYGYGVYRFDNRGHGQSGGIRAYVDDHEDFLNDADIIVDMAKSEYPDLPVYMLGHSMGAFITAAYGVYRPDKLDGEILSGTPAQVLPSLVSWIDDPNALYKIYPMYQIPNSLPEIICRDPEVVQAYIDDPLVLKYNTAKLLGEVFVEGALWLDANITNYNYPCLILHGGNDFIVPNAFSQWMYENISSEDKTIEIIPECYHEILNEKVEKDFILKDIKKWLDIRIIQKWLQSHGWWGN